MKGDLVKARLAARIAESAITLAIYKTPAASGTAGPTTRPASPLAPAAPAAAPAVVKTMQCLWLDAVTLAMTVGSDQRQANALGLVQGATAMARVTVTDAALDPTDPAGGTHFDAADYVESAGKQYRVLQVEPISGAFYAAHTYAVWLQSATKQ